MNQLQFRDPTGVSTLPYAVTLPAGAIISNGVVDLTAVYLNKEVTTTVTNATATMAALTDLTVSLDPGGVYAGTMAVKCSNSTAAEGVSIDLDGGTATMSAFAAGAGVLTGGTTVAVTTTSTAIATDLNWTTITGETWITIQLAFTVSTAGTFIPRVCEGTAHASGTLTVSVGTNLRLVRVS